MGGVKPLTYELGGYVLQNIKKFAREFELYYKGDSQRCYLNCNGLDFMIRKGGKGVMVSCKYQSGDFNVTTQKSAIWSIIETLRWAKYIDDTVKNSMLEYLSKMDMYKIKANVGMNKRGADHDKY